MRKIRHLWVVLCALVLLAVTLPVQTVKADAAYTGTIELRGQYSRSTGANQHEFNKNEARAYNSGDQAIGNGSEHEGLFNHLRTNFVGWTDQPLTASGDVAEGARVFLASDKISTAFPNGLTADSKLYAIYVTAEVPDQSDVLGALGWIGAENKGALKTLTNSQVNPQVNPQVSAEDTLPQTELDATLSDEASGRIVDTYEQKDDIEKINEVIAQSSFSMNPRVALLVYSNPTFGYGGGRVFTENYAEKFQNNSFNKKTGKTADYTYVDITVSAGAGMRMPEKFYLKFDAASWRPLYMLEGETALEILDPITGVSLGNAATAFDSLVRKDSSEVLFGVSNPNRASTLTMRAILRSSGGGRDERIAPTDLKTTAGKSQAETVLNNMTLNILSSSEVKALQPTLTNAEANALVPIIPEGKAAELADTQGQTRIPVTGEISGAVRLSIGKRSVWGMNFDLSHYVLIDRKQANTIELGYTRPRTTDFSATKTWVDGPKADHVQADLQLWKRAIDAAEDTGVAVTDVTAPVITPVVDPATPENQTVYRYVWSDLPKYDADGKELVYSVKELDENGQPVVKGSTIGNYVVDYDAASIAVTNTYQIPMTDLKVTKKWVNGPAQKPEVAVRLYQDGNEMQTATLETPDGSDEAETTFRVPATTQDGTVLQYHVREVDQNGASVADGGLLNDQWQVTYQEQAGETVITNSFVPRKKTITVKKIWNGGPEEKPQIELQLMRNGVEIEAPKSLLSGQETLSWENMDETDIEGNEYQYTVKEVQEPDNYDAAVAGDGLTITNTYVPSKTAIEVKKVWTKGPAANAVEIILYANGEEKDRVELTQAMNWKHSFTELPKTTNTGETITYTINETPITGYEAQITGDQALGFTVTNRNIETVTIAVQKRWIGEQGVSADVFPLANGIAVGTNLQLKEENGWQGQFVLPKYDADGNAVVYTVGEAPQEGYTTEITGDMQSGFVVTNTKIQTPVPPAPTPNPPGGDDDGSNPPNNNGDNGGSADPSQNNGGDQNGGGHSDAGRPGRRVPSTGDSSQWTLYVIAAAGFLALGLIVVVAGRKKHA